MFSIYEFYETSVLLPKKTKVGIENYSYICILCWEMDLIKDNEFIRIKCEKGIKD